MAYTETAIARRRCTATRRDGTPCGAWALWEDAGRRCVFHAPRDRPRRPWPAWWGKQRAQYPRCTCPAYAWPHRPGGGLCRWPEAPAGRSPVPAGTRRAGLPPFLLAALRRREATAARGGPSPPGEDRSGALEAAARGPHR